MKKDTDTSWLAAVKSGCKAGWKQYKTFRTKTRNKAANESQPAPLVPTPKEP